MSCQDRRLIHALRLPGGDAVTVRPLCREDGARLQAYVRALSPATRYNRFLGPVSELPETELARAAGDDHRDRLTLVAETGADGERSMIGEARYAVTPDRHACEFAISVADTWRGKGLGSLLIADLECRARELGIGSLVGDVLRTNAPMQRLARKAGFDMTGPPAEARLVRVVKDISLPETAPPCGEFLAPELSIAA